MKILTYNVWNSEQGMPDRSREIVRELKYQQGDICCLQEVSVPVWEEMRCAFPNRHLLYHQDAELLLISRFDCLLSEECEYGQIVLLDTPLGMTAIGNIHLPWDGAAKRESSIISIVEKLEGLHGVHTLLAGDFNCSAQSSVQRYLKGEQSLNGKETCYFDLAESAEEVYGIPAEATLDFRVNPRWRNGSNTIECNQRFDRILLKNPYPGDFPILQNAGIFGKEKSRVTGLCPSDHYGVYAVLQIK